MYKYGLMLPITLCSQTYLRLGWAYTYRANERPNFPLTLSGFERFAEEGKPAVSLALTMIDGMVSFRLHFEFLKQTFGN